MFNNQANDNHGFCFWANQASMKRNSKFFYSLNLERRSKDFETNLAGNISFAKLLWQTLVIFIYYCAFCDKKLKIFTKQLSNLPSLLWRTRKIVTYVLLSVTIYLLVMKVFIIEGWICCSARFTLYPNILIFPLHPSLFWNIVVWFTVEIGSLNLVFFRWSILTSLLN